MSLGAAYWLNIERQQRTKLSSQNTLTSRNVPKLDNILDIMSLNPNIQLTGHDSR